jgi:hypothetical protein
MYPHSHIEFPTKRAFLRGGLTLLGGAAMALIRCRARE